MIYPKPGFSTPWLWYFQWSFPPLLLSPKLLMIIAWPLSFLKAAPPPKLPYLVFALWPPPPLQGDSDSITTTVPRSQQSFLSIGGLFYLGSLSALSCLCFFHSSASNPGSVFPFRLFPKPSPSSLPCPFEILMEQRICLLSVHPRPPRESWDRVDSLEELFNSSSPTSTGLISAWKSTTFL